MSLLLRQLPAAKRATTCLRRIPLQRLYSSQSAVQLRSDAEHDIPAPHAPETSSEPVNLEADIAPPKRAKVAKAKKSTSKTKKEEAVVDIRDPLEPTNVERYLARIQSEGGEPTLEDLEKFRPEETPRGDSRKYPQKYHALADTLCRSFSRDQLYKFVRLCGLAAKCKGKSPRKLDLAEAIIEHRWDWPNLKEIERARRDREEIVTEAFPVSPNALFLILGRDGADLLQLSKKYNAHLSLMRDPLALRIEGSRAKLRPLLETLRAITKDIVEETVQLPTRSAIRPDLVQRISRLAEAYIENIGEKGLVRICAKDRQSLSNARRLATRASGEMISASHAPVVSYIPAGVSTSPDVPEATSPYNYSLYPFLSPRALPWYMNTSGAFRVRRVGQWLSTSQGEDVNATGGLAGGKGQFLTVNNEGVDLRSALFPASTRESSSRRTLKAITGHVLFNTESAGQHATLRPPLKGSFHFAKILDWMARHVTRAAFISALPVPLVHSPPSDEKIIHRLVYKALPASDKPYRDSKTLRREVITYEVVLAQPKQTTESTSSVQSEAQPDFEALSESESYASEETDASQEAEPNLSIDPQCEKGTETVMDLMMPDRAMDVRLQGLELEPLREDWQPAELREYTANLRAFLSTTEDASQPDPPLTMNAYGKTYILHVSSTVRQSIDQVVHARAGNSTAPLNVISESILDLESSQRTTTCEIVCADPSSDEEWVNFLAVCDSLSSASYRPQGSISLDLPGID